MCVFIVHVNHLINMLACLLGALLGQFRFILIFFNFLVLFRFLILVLGLSSYRCQNEQKKNHFLLVIGVVIFICVVVFGVTLIFRCVVIRPRAANCFAFIVVVAIVGNRGLCCCINAFACWDWFGCVVAKLTFTPAIDAFRICCVLKFFTLDAVTNWAKFFEMTKTK